MTGTRLHDVQAFEAALAALEARVAAAEAKASDAEAQVVALTLMIEKLRRALYGSRSERKERRLDQLELSLEELEASAAEDELAVEKAAAQTTEVKSFVRRKPSRKLFPDHLPRERVVVPGPVFCSCCGSERLSKIGEDITETLEVMPRRWKVIQTVREKFTRRTARSSPSRLHPSTRHRAAGRGPTCWRRSSSRSTGSISLSTDRGTTTRGQGSISASRRWPTRWVHVPWR